MTRPTFVYPYPGYFLELVREHQFPPDFRPQPVIRRGSFDPNEAAARGRATAEANGHSFTSKRIAGDVAKALIKRVAAT